LDPSADHAGPHFDAVRYFRDEGFAASIVDLRSYFDRRAALASTLARYRIVWALGGNAFVLRLAMRYSRFDEVICDLLDDGLVYAGWSAGACVAGCSLRSLALIDEPTANVPDYPSGELVWDGLGLVPFEIIPHVDSNHPEAASAASAVAWASSHSIAHKALRDGDVIVVDGGPPELLAGKRA
jgi:dipeptidase E